MASQIRIVRSQKKIARTMKAVVTVMPKRSVLDPQGAAVAQAIAQHGIPDVARVRVGKVIEIECGSADETALHALCNELLSNPVIEDYAIRFEE